mgnify:CR=1 FL=1
MAVYFLWGSIALIVLVLLCGFLTGFYRGLKRSSLHVLFAVVSVVVAFFITKPITNAILGININVDGSLISIGDYIVQLVSQNLVDLSYFDTASTFIQQLPTAILSPIIFLIILLLVYLVMDIIYLIVARVSFGTKKADFEKHKPWRWPSGAIGLCEAFLFMIVLFAPITSLTYTYEEIMTSPTTAEYVSPEGDNYLKTIKEYSSSALPETVNEVILSFNDSAIGVICSAGGFDDAMFDGLSSFSIDGESVGARGELVNLAHTYDEFVVVYNDIMSEDYTNLNITNLKNNLTTLIQNNLFKKVITDTVQDFIVNYDALKLELGITNVPPELEEVIDFMQDKFQDPNFSLYDYISSDLITALDVADNVISDDIMDKFSSLDTSNISAVINFALDEQTLIQNSLNSLLTLNTVSDVMPQLLELASNALQEQFTNEEGIVVGLNTSVNSTDLTSVVSSVFKILNDVDVINEANNNQLFEIFNSENILESILGLNDVEAVIDGMGGILDEASSLSIFNYTSGDEQINSFNNVLKIMGIDVLGDEVLANSTIVDGVLVSDEMTTINSYTAFFNHIKEPVLTIINSGLTDILNEEVDANAVIEILTEQVELNPNFVADLLMPFYELDKATISGSSLKAMVFDNVKNMLEENLNGFITFEETEDNYVNWYNNLASIGELLSVMSDGNIQVEENSYTYLEYLMQENQENVDYLTLIENMQTDGNVSALLNVVFNNNMYNPLNDQLFSTFDSMLEEITGINPQSEAYKTNLQANADLYVSTINTLIETLLSSDMQSENLQDKLLPIGRALDTLKVSAKNNVLNEIFVNIIWYLTGDVIGDNPIYADQTPNHDFTDEIKAQIGIAEDEIDTGYYEVKSYEEIMQQVLEVVDFAGNLSEALDSVLNGEPISEENIESYLDTAIETIKTQFVDEKESFNEEKAIEVIERASKITSDFVSEEMQQYSTQIEEFLSSKVSDNTIGKDLANAIKNLFGIGAQSGI